MELPATYCQRQVHFSKIWFTSWSRDLDISFVKRNEPINVAIESRNPTF